MMMLPSPPPTEYYEPGCYNGLRRSKLPPVVRNLGTDTIVYKQELVIICIDRGKDTGIKRTGQATGLLFSSFLNVMKRLFFRSQEAQMDMLSS